ncbi:LysM peptidoglycan-binding domain-containing protein [Spirilliplanes yamanashiensis]|uniref:LysM peptidoglycan-binding domain-containing protein n=1 Tax=Spirilliplanes yamanashiensis TaxID=42233 RepID=UPI00194E37A0|nr:LysM peptidoglycan-binding domain-containing protein [Spirilliplanes yamanashiensis]MDP9819559.1 LysM repeat protein [Spirilliplanes yamanashiensis]
MRLTRRGRAAVLGFFLVVNTTCGILLASASRAADPAPGVPAAGPTAVVGPHDTLWSIASRHDPGRSPAAVVADIRRLNDLSGSVVHPGESLLLPRAE